eukprot:gnl/Dysnectes_brevis/4277_a5667_742.p1 GENE.gnl/Dysnectes_brevis/4277_a5667_742~~gnl/Dysnectes_brevis/4277_a5667_742.p1  ORF type:complete len:175 (+),score=8.04 gnl/Dysnectes_brevis/4277_a5667_742:171-695(+)
MQVAEKQILTAEQCPLPTLHRRVLLLGSNQTQVDIKLTETSQHGKTTADHFMKMKSRHSSIVNNLSSTSEMTKQILALSSMVASLTTDMESVNDCLKETEELQSIRLRGQSLLGAHHDQMSLALSHVQEIKAGKLTMEEMTEETQKINWSADEVIAKAELKLTQARQELANECE